MDVASLTLFLVPFLPFLLKLGNKAAEGAAEKFGVDAWEKAKAIWAKLYPKVATKPAVQEAIEDVAAAPDDEDLQAALRVQLKKLLEKDQSLAEAITQIISKNLPVDSSTTSILQNVTGDNNQTSGQVDGNSKVIGSVQGNVTM